MTDGNVQHVCIYLYCTARMYVQRGAPDILSTGCACCRRRCCAPVWSAWPWVASRLWEFVAASAAHAAHAAHSHRCRQACGALLFRCSLLPGTGRAHAQVLAVLRRPALPSFPPALRWDGSRRCRRRCYLCHCLPPSPHSPPSAPSPGRGTMNWFNRQPEAPPLAPAPAAAPAPPPKSLDGTWAPPSAATRALRTRRASLWPCGGVGGGGDEGAGAARECVGVTFCGTTGAGLSPELLNFFSFPC